jgi:hypothetical protein
MRERVDKWNSAQAVRLQVLLTDSVGLVESRLGWSRTITGI